MTAATRRPNRGRLAALAVIVLLLLGMGYLRFAPGPKRVTVPAGARAGDLTLQPCSYATENGGYAADCGTFVAPENRANPQSRLIALPVTRIRARSEHPGNPIFYLEGGPGITNINFKQASRYADDRDVVLVGYRGVDGSVRLDCPEVSSALKHSRDFLGEQSFQAYGDGLRACAVRLTADGVDLAGYGLPQQVDDLEAVRTALGYDQIDLLSQSAGTRTAMLYAWRYPESIQRSVMIGVNPPGHFLWDPQTTDEQLARYADQCANDASCRTRTDDLAASMRRTAVNLPSRWLVLPIKQGNVRVASFIGLMESTSKAGPLSAPIILDAWLSAAQGDASGLWLTSLAADVMVPGSFVWGEYAAAGSLDDQAARAYFTSDAQARDSFGYAGSAFSWGGGTLADAWPANPSDEDYTQMRPSNVETLLVGGQLDTSTPPQVTTKELLPYLPNGHQVVLSGFGHTASFFAEQPEAGSWLINTFFDNGQVDDSLYTPATIDFTPGPTLSAYAKFLLGLMVGLALIMVGSLLWMPRHVRRQGRFGRNASAALRSLYPIVLGLGGWCLGALLVLTFWPTVPLDSELLAVVSVSVPIGLGVYWAWVHRRWSDRIRTVGLVAALCGALLGAWLGFNATSGLLSLITTIVGAAAITNLSVIVFDIWRERSVPSPLGATTPPPAVSNKAG